MDDACNVYFRNFRLATKVWNQMTAECLISGLRSSVCAEIRFHWPTDWFSKFKIGLTSRSLTFSPYWGFHTFDVKKGSYYPCSVVVQQWKLGLGFTQSYVCYLVTFGLVQISGKMYHYVIMLNIKTFCYFRSWKCCAFPGGSMGTWLNKSSQLFTVRTTVMSTTVSFKLPLFRQNGTETIKLNQLLSSIELVQTQNYC